MISLVRTHQGCIIVYLFKVVIRIGNVEDFHQPVETGFAFCITTYRILQLVRYVCPIRLLGSFIGTIMKSIFRT